MGRNALIMARNKDYVISVDGMMPWHCPNDLRHFKETTMMYEHMVMGHNTFKMLPQVLNKRKHIVLTTNPLKASLDCAKSSQDIQEGSLIVFMELHKVIQLMLNPRTTCIVIGGAKTAKILMQYVDEILLTTIYEEPKPTKGLEILTFDYCPHIDFKSIGIVRYPDCKIERFERRDA